ncbi:MAG TPA: hypothetical protein VF945_02250, partial [Polyangia bacterium]
MRTIVPRATLLAALLAAGVARADMAMPIVRAAPRWTLACEARFQQARDEAAAILPIFNLAHVYGPGLYLDENILGSDVPVLLEAGVLPSKEPALVAYRFERWATRAQLERVTRE